MKASQLKTLQGYHKIERFCNVKFESIPLYQVQ